MTKAGEGVCGVSVADDGAGIDEKGMFLSIVRQIILQHGHKITVSSAEGEGPTFTYAPDLAKRAKK